MDLRTLPTVILLAAVLALGAGCGGESVASAKQKLIDSCHKDHPGDARDLKLCQCIADKLESEQNFKTAKQFNAARQAVESGKQQRDISLVVASCAKLGITASG